MKTLDKTRKRLEMQGYKGLSDKDLSEAAPWIRFSPAVCGIWTAIATYMGSYTLIWALVPFAFFGAIFPYHPFDALYNLGIRHLLGRKALPKNKAPRLFTCGVATVWLLSAGYSFYTGFDLTGTILGYAMVGVTVLVSTTDFCIPSWLFGKMFSPSQKLEVEA